MHSSRAIASCRGDLGTAIIVAHVRRQGFLLEEFIHLELDHDFIFLSVRVGKSTAFAAFMASFSGAGLEARSHVSVSYEVRYCALTNSSIFNRIRIC
jgi:hypothetical protein